MKKREQPQKIPDSTTQIILTETIERDFRFRTARQKLKIMLWIWVILLLIAQGMHLLALFTEATEGSLLMPLCKSVGCMLFSICFALMMYGGVRMTALLSLLVMIPTVVESGEALAVFLQLSSLEQFSLLLFYAALLIQVITAGYIFCSKSMRHYEETMVRLGKKSRTKE